MAEEKKYIIGDFEYTLLENGRVRIAYAGPTGPGSVATVPESVVIEGESRGRMNSFSSALRNLDIEKVVYERHPGFELQDMPSLKVIEGNVSNFYIDIDNCPNLEAVIVKSDIGRPVALKGEHGHVRIEYQGKISDKELEVAGDNIHAVFGDEATEIGIIRGGHVTLGKNVKEIKVLKKAEMGINADITVKEYELPTRIDFLTAEPPVVGTVAPGSITTAELHVPNGALDAYMNHAQWGKAAYFVEEGGKTVDKYAAKHKARMKKLQKERDEAGAKAAERAKQEKIEAIGGMMHSTMAPQRLAKWNPGSAHGSWNDVEISVNVGQLRIKLIIPKDAPIDIYDKIEAKLKSVEAELNEVV